MILKHTHFSRPSPHQRLDCRVGKGISKGVVPFFALGGDVPLDRVRFLRFSALKRA